MNTKLKYKIYNACKNILQQRIDTARHAIKAAQEAANNEEKSSMGDKYETGRAMSQLAKEMNEKQLSEAEKESVELDKIIDKNKKNADAPISVKNIPEVKLGSIIETNNGIFFLAIGLGNINIDEKKIMVLSAKAPLAQVMMNKKINENFTFNQRNFVINEIL